MWAAVAKNQSKHHSRRIWKRGSKSNPLLCKFLRLIQFLNFEILTSQEACCLSYQFFKYKPNFTKFCTDAKSVSADSLNLHTTFIWSFHLKSKTSHHYLRFICRLKEECNSYSCLLCQPYLFGQVISRPEQASPPISQIARGYMTTYKFSAAPLVGAENSWQGDIQLCNL